MILIFFKNVTYFNVFQIALRVATRDVLKVTLGILGNNNSCYALPFKVWTFSQCVRRSSQRPCHAPQYPHHPLISFYVLEKKSFLACYLMPPMFLNSVHGIAINPQHPSWHKMKIKKSLLWHPPLCISMFVSSHGILLSCVIIPKPQPSQCWGKKSFCDIPQYTFQYSNIPWCPSQSTIIPQCLKEKKFQHPLMSFPKHFHPLAFEKELLKDFSNIPPTPPNMFSNASTSLWVLFDVSSSPTIFLTWTKHP